MGYRQLQDMRYYGLGVSWLLDGATVSLTLAGADPQSVEHLRTFSQQQVLDQIQAPGLVRITFALSVTTHRRGYRRPSD